MTAHVVFDTDTQPLAVTCAAPWCGRSFPGDEHPVALHPFGRQWAGGMVVRLRYCSELHRDQHTYGRDGHRAF